MQRTNLTSLSALGMAVALAIGIIIIANTLFSSVRLDLTENKLFTLSDGTVNILDSLEEPITLEFYFSRKTLVDFPLLMNYATRVRDLLEEYAAKSNGRIKLTVIEPEPFSEEEDQAVANGLQGISVNASGDRAYFGLVGTNTIDTVETIPFFQTSKESALEYDITKLVYNLANPEKRVVGVISSLPLFGNFSMGQPTRPWAIINVMREFFEVRNLGTSTGKIDDDISVLLVIHPKELSEDTLFAIDQYLLSGGNTMIFVDPLAEGDNAQPAPGGPMSMPDLDSDLQRILDGWGIDVLQGKVAGDITLAMRVQTRSPRGPQETTYLPWLSLDESTLNQDDFTTNELNIIHMGTAGIIEKKDDSSLQFEPLIQTTPLSMQLDRDRLLFQQDPAAMLKDFTPENKRQVLAARLSGNVNTAFAEGKPGGTEDSGDEDKIEHLKEGDIHAILVADTDILADMFWVRTQSFFGMEIPQTIANNGDFVINTLENLSGNTDLVSLRSRGEYARPFEVVETIRREAEDKFREREQQLQAKLEETERKIVALQQESGDSTIILSPEQAREIEKFRDEQINTRKELRAVQHELQKNIEGLGTLLKFINIALIPLLIACLAIFAGVYRSGRRV